MPTSPPPFPSHDEIASLEHAVAYARKTCEEPWRAVREWRARHPDGRAVGYFPVYAPLPLMDACGVLPVGIVGGGSIEVDRADSRVQSFVCSISRSTLELGLRGTLDELDGMVFSNICDVARNLSGVWKRNFPERFTEYLHYPQNMASTSAAAYLESEFERLAERLLPKGKNLSSSALLERTALRNEQQRLLGMLQKARERAPWNLSWSEMYILRRAGLYLSAEEHIPLLQEAIRGLRQRADRKVRDGIFVLAEGAFCEQPPIELLDALEEAGAFVLEDDAILGLRWHTEPVPLNGTALKTLAESYLWKSVPSSVRHEGDVSRAEALVERVKRAGAHGVILMAPKFCEPALYDAVRMKDALDRASVPILTFEYEEKMGTFDAVRMQVETFVESVLFFSDLSARSAPAEAGRRAV